MRSARWAHRYQGASIVSDDSPKRQGPKGGPPGTSRPASVRVVLADPDPAWPGLFAREAERIRAALGPRALEVEHVGSTSVPGLPAKPIVDVLLVVADAADEPSYAPPLVAAGYVFHHREPEWHEHRLFNSSDTAVNLHVFSAGCVENGRMLSFRDRLRSDPADRELYLRTKRELAQRTWGRTQEYADAKGAVVEEILARAAAEPL
jgi:GrpB-like predicted nucleotidyltransferase (UPF0157 family)